MVEGDHRIYLWETATSKLTAILDHHQNHIQSHRYSADGKYIVSTATNGLFSRASRGGAYCWNASNGELLNFFEHNAAFDAQISTNNQFIMSVSGDWSKDIENGVKIWETISGKELHYFRGFSNFQIRHVCFSPDSELVAIATSHITVTIYNTVNGNFVQQFNLKESYILDIHFSPDGNYIVLSTDQNKVSLFNLAKKEWHYLDIGAKYSHVENIQFSKEGDLMLAESDKHTVKIWNFKTFKEVFALENASKASFSRDANIAYFDNYKGNQCMNLLTFPSLKFSLPSNISVMGHFGSRERNKEESMDKTEKRREHCVMQQ